MYKIIITLIIRDLKIYSRSWSDFMSTIAFMVTIVMLFPLAIGPQPDKLSFLSNAVLWIALIMSIIPSLDKIYLNDFKNGWLEQLSYSPILFEIVLLIKCLTYWLTLMFPIITTLTILSFILGIKFYLIVWNLMVFIIGSLAICLVGSICSSLTLGARTGNIISPLLILPLTIPVLIFGISTCEAIKSNLNPYPNLYLLISFSLILIILSPILTAVSVRIALSK